MKVFAGIIGVVILGAVIIMMGGSTADDPAVTPTAETVASDKVTAGADTQAAVNDDRTVVSESGEYQVVAESSRVFWAGKKPLVEGYVNSGSLGLVKGDISLQEGVVSGAFVIDMQTLSVSETPKKPGQENVLESHLKSDRWFDVAAHPEASFVITEATPQTDVETTFLYDVTGDLTLKGQTHEVSFPAVVYVDAAGMLHADASFEFDRTLWGITAGSGSFFDNLADNVIDDNVALSFALVATPE